MIQTLNTTHMPPAHISRPKNRHREASPSSATSSGAPETPEGAYSHSHDRSLGHEFSVLKMGGSRPSVKGSDPFNPAAFVSIGTDANRSIGSLPPWLEGTISTLEICNPLRLLLPDDVATGEERSLTTSPAASIFLEKPLANLTTTSAIEARASVNMKLADWSSHFRDHYGDTVSLELPFSTPGPASTTSLLPSPALAHSPAHPPTLVPIVSHRPLQVDAPVSSMFAPFAKPGPCSSTEHIIRPLVAKPLHLRRRVTSSPVQENASAILRLSQSPSHVPPFSTPGPVRQRVENAILTATNVRFVESPARKNPAFHIWPSLHDQPQQGSIPDLLYSSPVPTERPTKLSPASPRSSSVDGSPFSARQDHDAHDQFASPRRNFDYKALDLQWERFDRGDVVADPTSDSSCALLGSEEKFWSQPPRRLPALASPFQGQDDPALNSSPASLRLTGISTPSLTSPRSPWSQCDRGRPQDGNPFAWIVPPHHAGPPSTPQPKNSSSRMTSKSQAPHRPSPLGSASETEPAKTGGGLQWPGRTPRVAALDTSEMQGHSPRAAEQHVAFAPCAGIYISPLRSALDVGDGVEDVNGTSEGELKPGQRPRQADGIQVGITKGKLLTLEGPAEVSTLTDLSFLIDTSRTLR